MDGCVLLSGLRPMVRYSFLSSTFYSMNLYFSRKYCILTDVGSSRGCLDRYQINPESLQPSHLLRPPTFDNGRRAVGLLCSHSETFSAHSDHSKHGLWAKPHPLWLWRSLESNAQACERLLEQNF